MLLREYLNNCIARLREAGSSCPEDEAEKILLSASGKDRLWLYTSLRSPLEPKTRDKSESLLAERLTGRPLQYILGKAYFMDLELYVCEGVLIPRQDTELIAETAEEWLRERSARDGLRALDLCTGSGALAVWLKRRFPRIGVTASDISQRALEIAGLNAERNGCRIDFVSADLFDGISGPFDLIMTNPPYIGSAEIEGLSPEVRDHEPRLALDGGADGLDLIRKIINEAPGRLVPGGLLLMEIGESQEEAVISLAKERSAYDGIEVLKDLNGRPRTLRCLRR